MILSSIIIIIIIALLSLIIIESNNLVVGAEMMKIHPLPLTRNITIQFGNNINPNFGKKLRRLPHVFTRVLELPFRSDADVTIHDDPDCFRFVAETDRIADVRAHTIEIHPGVIKIAVRVGPSVEFSLDQLEIDMWRFRLPESTQPELATAAFVDGELIVTVPKRSENSTISVLPSARLHLEPVIRTGMSTVLDENAPLRRHCVHNCHPQ